MGKFLKDINLKNKVAVVTGATKGIGRSAAIALHQVGANVVAIGRNKNELSSLKKKLRTRIKCFSCDVNNYEEIKKIINSLNRVDVLVNNAGTNLPEPFLSVKKSSLETLLLPFISSKASDTPFKIGIIKSFLSTREQVGK